MSWRTCRLGDVLTLKRGHDLPEHSRQDGEVPVVSSSGITGRHKVAKALAPGVVTGRYGTIGEVFFLQEDYWPLNTALYVIDFKGNDPQFSAYFLRNVLRGYQSEKSAVPGVDRNVLHEIKVQAPSHPLQLRIADILSKYDDLIENNSRRMVLLEDSARQLYSEWFVRLRFPGYEHTSVVNGVPHGWKRETLGNLCSEIRETVLPEALEPGTPYIGLEHIPRRSISLSDWGMAEQVTSSKSRFKAGEIIFGKIRPYFHKVGVAFVDGVASSDSIVIRPKDVTLHGLILMTMSSDEFIAVTTQQMKEGSKMPRADWKQMQAYSIPLPPSGLLGNFDEVIQLIIEQLKSLSFANNKLRTTRDLLLPRLMNGKLAV
jgi:type I restriction enzyme S subunit